ncbi:MAG: DUF459 domain-containing protein [Acidimicrobiales bacterium]|nr:DUF459 domain-containing protein [Acidimicrobiales bacterium]
MNRRTAHGAVLVALVAGVVALAAGACATDVEAPAVAQGTSATTAAPTTTSSVPPGGRRPTAEDPLRVVLAGDSVMNGLAPAVATALNEGGESQVSYELAPSIARDTASRVLWQQRLEQDHPDLVVMLIGTWERGDANFNPGDPAWASWYQEQVLDPFAEMVTGTGARILWVGMPAVRDEADTLQLVALNSQFRALAERDDRVEYVEGGDFLNGPDGGYTDELPRADGTPERVRRLDGLHLCPGGSERLAIPVVQYAQQEWEVAVGYNWQNAPWREPPTLDHPEECPPV